MAVTAKLYGSVVAKVFNKEIDYDTDTIKVALLTGYTPDQDAHDYFNDVSSTEITGTGYTAGGATLASKTVTYSSGTNRTVFDAADTTWTTSTLSATHAVIYDATPGTSATNPLIAYVDFGGTVSSTGSTFQITWDATDGVFQFTVS